MSILTLEHCSHSFGGRSIFEDVSFRLLKVNTSDCWEPTARARARL